MISYDPFFRTLLNKDITIYYLAEHQKIDRKTLYRMRAGLPMNTTTLDRLCAVLDCRVEDVLEYRADDEAQS